jgi:hypothetical protein
MPSFFVKPTTVRLELPEDQWIEAKERLSFGDQQALNAAGLTRLTTPTEGAGAAEEMGVGIDMARWMVERIAVWLVDWSIRDDDDGKPVAVSRDAIRALDPVWATRIQDALDAHVRAVEEKKATPTRNGRTPTGTR